MAEEVRKPFQVRLTEEQFWTLFDQNGYDDEFIGQACLWAYWKLPTPKNPVGRTQSGIRMYKELYGFHASGYTLVHWDDAKKLDWCLDNGYYTSMPESEKPVIWEPEPEENERILSLRDTMLRWAYG